MPPFKLDAVYTPDRRSAGGDRRARRGHRGGRALHDAARRHRHRQDDDDGGDDRGGCSGRRSSSRTTRRSPRSSATSSARTSRSNAVEYFVSYYDYYQPEAYVPTQGPLHREGLGDQPGDRPPAPRRDGGAVRAPRRDHRRLGVGDLRPRLAGDLRRATADAAQGRRRRRPRRAAAQARLDPVHAQRHGARAAARSACAARRWRSSRPTPRRPSARMLFGDEVERLQHFDPLTGELIEDDLEHVGDLAGDALQRQGGHDRARGRRDRPRAQRALAPSSRPRASCSSPTACASARSTTWRCCARSGFCSGIENYSRILDGRTPGDAAVLPDRLLPRGLRLLHRRVAPDRAADRRHVRGRPLAQADARRLRLPAAERARQPAADVRRVPLDHAADGVRVGDAGRVRARALQADRRADRAPDRASSTRRSRCARRATRSTT